MSGQVGRVGRQASGADLGLAIVRIAVSMILVWGALTNLAQVDRIDALAAVWATAGLPQPHLLVMLSITLQLALGLLLLVGLFARMAGVLVGLNFAAAAAVSGIFAGTNWWAFALLVLLLLHFGLIGGGRWSVDALVGRRFAARTAPPSGSLEDLLASIGVKPLPEDSNNPS